MFEAWVVWVVLALAVLALELVAVFNGRKGDTISESIWWLLRRGFGVALVPLYLWLGWHLFVEFWFFPDLRDTLQDDLILILVAAAITAFAQWRRGRQA